MLRRLLVVGIGVVVLVWAAWQGIDAWRYRTEMTRAEREVARGDYAQARMRLARLSSRWPGVGAVELPLGACEAALGHVDEAFAAWARVPANSDEAARADLRTARLALEHGRFSLAERVLGRIERAPGDMGEQAHDLLRELFLYTGRIEELLALIRQEWETGRDPIVVLRTHWQLEGEALPVAAIASALDKAEHASPEDDRVWLGRASLATRLGRFDEADAWLKRCEARRPDDPIVWRARLDWALAADRLDEAERALPHLAADRVSAADVLGLRARFAARKGDTAAERAALEKRLELVPGDQHVIERLSEIALAAGDARASASLRRRAAALDKARDVYRAIMMEGAFDSHLEELAKSAEALGRRFEAKGWWTLWARRGGDLARARAAIDRIGRDQPPAPRDARTLADLLADVLPRDKSGGAEQAGGRPAPNVPTFRDDAESAGLRFVYDNGRSDLRRLPETMGGGVGLLDFDGDGLLDVYAVQGGSFPPDPNTRRDGDRLFRNKGDGTFEDVTELSGIADLRQGYGHGVTVGDYDNDGFPDLFVTRWRSYALYHNQGDGTFEDATDAAGLGGGRDWPTSSAFADLDNDGDLDLYVCHYLEWDPERSKPCTDPKSGQHVYCVPRGFPALPDHVFRNDGGRFVDVTAESGMLEHDGRGLGVIAADVDDDGRVDLFVANDMTANYLYRNLGGFRFREEGIEAGTATNAEGGYQAGMGVAAGDIDGDGRIDLGVTNFYGESTTLYRNLGEGRFIDQTAASGLAAPSRYVLGFGLAFLDVNNDGMLDVASANGHVNDFTPVIPYAMPAQLLLGIGGGRLEDVSARAGAAWEVPRLGRGLAAGDVDRDGRLDLLILSQNGPLAYFHNAGSASGHALELRLDGRTSNRDAVGTRLIVNSGGRRQVTQRYGGGSFLSANDGAIHLGLGAASRAESVEVRWPSGKVDRYRALEAGRGYRLREGDPKAQPLRAWK